MPPTTEWWYEEGGEVVVVATTTITYTRVHRGQLDAVVPPPASPAVVDPAPAPVSPLEEDSEETLEEDSFEEDSTAESSITCRSSGIPSWVTDPMKKTVKPGPGPYQYWVPRKCDFRRRGH